MPRLRRGGSLGTSETISDRGSPQGHFNRRGPDRFVQITLSREALADGWAAFAGVAKHARDQQNGRRGGLEYSTHRETPIGVTAIFRLVP